MALTSGTVRAAELYVAGHGKVAELRELSFSVKPQGERVSTSGATVKSKGAVVTDIDFSTVVPLKGMRVRLMKMAIAQEDLTIIIPVDGTRYAVDGTLDEASFKSIVQSGMTTGDFKFGGGEPIEV